MGILHSIADSVTMRSIAAGIGEWSNTDADDVEYVPEAKVKRARYRAVLPHYAQLHFRFKYTLADGQKGARLQQWPGKRPETLNSCTWPTLD